MKKEIIKYSDDFKLTVIKLLEDGTLESIEAARRMFNIKGSSIISRWIKKYGKEDILPKVRMRRMVDEVDNYKGTDLYEKILIRLQ
ncbi:MAG: transposase [Ignavibacteriales bacterium]|nr:transposase [Ignavibacteriales bacterium]